jgi:ACS family sodium-dependent inorganic phosphate cotransporter
MGFYKIIPFLNMFVFSINIRGVIADHLIITKRMDLLNTIGFVVASLLLLALPIFPSSACWVYSESHGY